MPAKAVDLEHRLPLLARQYAHRGVKRAAGSSRPIAGAGGGFNRHAPAAGLDTPCRPVARLAISLMMPARLKPRSPTGKRWTRWLKGSRAFRSRTILSAKA